MGAWWFPLFCKPRGISPGLSAAGLPQISPFPPNFTLEGNWWLKQHQALSPFTKPGAQSLPSPCTVERGRGTGWEAAGERAEASVDLLGAGVGRVSLRRASRGLALSWLGAEGLLGRGGLGGVWEVGAALPACGVAVWALLEVLSFSSGLAGLSAGIWVSATFSTAVLLSFPTSAPAGSPSSPTLPAAISVLSSGDCRSGLALLSIFPLTANFPRWCVQTNVPASEPGLYEPGSRVLEHSLHLPRRRKSPVRWEYRWVRGEGLALGDPCRASPLLLNRIVILGEVVQGRRGTEKHHHTTVCPR